MLLSTELASVVISKTVSAEWNAESGTCCFENCFETGCIVYCLNRYQRGHSEVTNHNMSGSVPLTYLL